MQSGNPGGCLNVPQNCSDNNACTSDVCDPVEGCQSQKSSVTLALMDHPMSGVKVVRLLLDSILRNPSSVTVPRLLVAPISNPRRARMQPFVTTATNVRPTIV